MILSATQLLQVALIARLLLLLIPLAVLLIISSLVTRITLTVKTSSAWAGARALKAAYTWAATWAVTPIKCIWIFKRLHHRTIFPQVGGWLLWHSKIFYLVFSKNFVVFEKRPFKIFQKTFLLRNILFFGKVFILASNFGVWPFETSSLLVLSQNYFWEFNLGSLSKLFLGV